MVIKGFISGMPIGATDNDAFRVETSYLKEHCQTLNWDDEEDHRIVASILVNSVYLLEKERPSTLWRKTKSLLSPHKIYSKDWSEAVGFKKIDEFFEGNNRNIFGSPSFGAIFEYSPSKNVDARWRNTANAPAFVIAFRGTTNLWDILLDLGPVANDFASIDRLLTANEKVKNFLDSGTYKNLRLSQGRTSPVKVWITGHSLGGTTAISAAMGIIEAKPTLIQLSEFKTLLFNPPFVSTITPENMLFGKLYKKLENTIGDLLQGVLSVKKEDIRERLYEWFPHIYVNPGDYISRGFIPYFRERYNNRNIQIGGCYFRTSDGTDVGFALNIWTDSKSLHLLPSAVLHVNSRMTNVPKSSAEMEEMMEDPDRNSWLPDFLRAHQLRQWWNPSLKLDPPEMYRIATSANTAGQR